MKNNSISLRWLFSRHGLVYFSLCLLLLNLSGRGALYIIYSFVFCLLLVGLYSFPRPDKMTFLIIAFSSLYSFISYLTGTETNIPFLFYFSIVPAFFYIYGRLLIFDLYSNGSEGWFIDVFIGVIICFSFFIFYDLFVGRGIQFGDIAEERIYDFSVGDHIISATGIGNFLCLCFVGFSCFFYLKKNFIRKVILLIVSVFALVITSYFVNRAGLVITVLCFAVLSLYSSRTKKAKVASSILVIISIILYIILNTKAGAELLLNYTARNNIFLTEEGGRLQLWLNGLKNIIPHPLGWAAPNVPYCHNMWLDVARISGIVPFVIMILITIRSLKDLFFILKNDDSNITVLLLGLYTCIFAAMFEEPIINSIPTLLFVFFMIMGCIRQIRNCKERPITR